MGDTDPLTTVQELKKKFSWATIKSWLLRNVVWVIIAGVLFYFLKPTYALIHNLMIIGLLETFAIAFSGVALFCITKLNFINKLINDKDDIVSMWEMLAAAIIVSATIIGVHILIGLSWYIMQFNETF